MNPNDLESTDVPQAEPCAPWRQWGSGLEPDAVKQMANACTLPIAIAGALMPDAHIGYGLPIGGVLATQNSVIPYGVGVDIACRMKMTVFDRPAKTIAGQKDRLANIIESETRFGIGANFKRRREHEVMDADWTVSPLTHRLRDKAVSLGSSPVNISHFFRTVDLAAPVHGSANITAVSRWSDILNYRKN
jgi:tRNA-splicing ligase RtcB